MRLLLIALTSFVVFSVNGETLFKPIYSVQKDNPLISSLSFDRVIHETKNHYILRSRATDFKNNEYYYLQLDERIKDLTWLKGKGEIIDYAQGEFAVLKPLNEKALLEVAEHLHHIGGQCGLLQKLSPMPVDFRITQAVPLFAGKDANVASTIKSIDYNNIVDTISTMVSWKTRYHKDSDGEQTAKKLKELYEKHVPNTRNDVEFVEYKHSGSPQDSLIVRIKGSESPDEIVILGSHLDSINNNNNKDAPGADDNASGTSTNLEVFRVLMENNIVPKKTIEIHAYGAEEIGLVGSGEIADQYKSDSIKVVSMVQFDMNGYSKDGKGKVFFVSNGTDSNLNKQLGQLVDDYLTIPWGSQFLIFGSSDHASWNKRGYPVSFPTENPFSYNNSIHTKDDTLKNINVPEQMGEWGKLGVAYFMHFAGY